MLAALAQIPEFDRWNPGGRRGPTPKSWALAFSVDTPSCTPPAPQHPETPIATYVYDPSAQGLGQKNGKFEVSLSYVVTLF